MKKIIKKISSFVVALLLMSFVYSPVTFGARWRNSMVSIDSVWSNAFEDLQFSNVSFQKDNAKCGLKGSIFNKSDKPINYTVHVYYQNSDLDDIASSNITGTAKVGVSDFSTMSDFKLIGKHSIDEIKTYSFSIETDQPESSSSSSTSDKYSVDSSRDYVINKYDVSINVNENNTFDVTETITAHFNKGDKHGLYRKIPLNNKVVRSDGTTSTNRAKVSNLIVDNNYTKTLSNGNLKIKIGDEKSTVTGEQKYTLKYTYDIGADPVKTYDELYYNIIGDEWDTTISGITFKITMPKGFDVSKLGFSSGAKGLTANSKVKYDVSGNTITGNYDGTLNPKEALTVRCELPEGYFVREPFVKNPLLICLMFIVPILGLLATIFLWHKFIRGKIVETVEFYPPEGLNSLDVGLLYNGRARPKDVTSLLVYLANKGYIKIRDTGRRKSTKIIKLKNYDGNDINEKMFLDELFEKGSSNKNNQKSVTLGDLKYNFYDKTKEILSKVNSSEKMEKVFGRISWKLPIIACFLMVISFITTIAVPTIEYMEYIDYEFFETTLWSYVIGIILVLVLDILIICTVKKIDFRSLFSYVASVLIFCLIMIMATFVKELPVFVAMIFDITYSLGVAIGIICLIGMMIVLRLIAQQRTEYGNEMLGKLKGFKHFLRTAEKEKLEAMVMQDPTYFYDILPYTYVLGVSNKWIKKFESISMPEPSWYDSYNTFNFASFSHYMNSTQRTMLSYRSSDSSSGGGVSGGGSGGGGGGAW